MTLTDIDSGWVARAVAVAVVLVVMAGMAGAGPAGAQQPPPNAPCPPDTPRAEFVDRDDARTGHEPGIDCVAFHGIAVGSEDADANPVYLPAGVVNRAQMATFIANALEAAGADLPAGDASDEFIDIADTVHRPRINDLARAGVVAGFPDDSYRPTQAVTRAQMASFIVQAAEWALDDDLTADAGPYFADTRGNTHEANIDAGFEAGLYDGRAAPDPDIPRSGRYAPRDGTRRDQMATFLSRLLDHLWSSQGLAGLVTSATTGDPIPGAIVTIEPEPVDPDAEPDFVNTDEQGRYEIDLDPGTYTVTATADDYEELDPRTGVTVTQRNVTTVNFQLQPVTPPTDPEDPEDPESPADPEHPVEPETGAVLGRVAQATTRAPIPDATVTVFEDDEEVTKEAVDAMGNYSIELETGTFTVTADAPGYLPSIEEDVAITADTYTTVDFELLFAPGAAVLTPDRELAPVSDEANPRQEALSRGDINFVLTLYDEDDEVLDPAGYDYSFTVHNTGTEEVWACVRCVDEGMGTDTWMIPPGKESGLSGVQNINRVRLDAADPTSVEVRATAAHVSAEDSASASWVGVDQEPTGQSIEASFSGNIIAFDHAQEWYLLHSTPEIVFVEYRKGTFDTYAHSFGHLEIDAFQETIALGVSISYSTSADGQQIHWLERP